MVFVQSVWHLHLQESNSVKPVKTSFSVSSEFCYTTFSIWKTIFFLLDFTLSFENIITSQGRISFELKNEDSNAVL